MYFLQAACLIMLIFSATVSYGDFELEENGKGDMNRHKTKESENSLHRYKAKFDSENGHPRLQTKLKRSRRTTSDEAEVPENVWQCPLCNTSYTRHFSGECFFCPSGTPGPRGPPGQQGIPGRDGRDGRDAIYERSDVGISNSPGRQGGSSLTGAVYVRWGRNECPPQSELIYQGIAAGGHYSHTGSGSNYLCMPDEPIYDEPVAGTSDQNRGYVYAAEYEMNTFANWNTLHDNNVYCAVCLASNRPSFIMIPARNICPGSEWTKEYSGYLVSDYYNHPGRTEFVCMDRSAEPIPRSVHNTNGALLYPVEGRCGSSGSGLLCEPYVDGYELTCAVCTR